MGEWWGGGEERGRWGRWGEGEGERDGERNGERVDRGVVVRTKPGWDASHLSLPLPPSPLPLSPSPPISDPPPFPTPLLFLCFRPFRESVIGFVVEGGGGVG